MTVLKTRIYKKAESDCSIFSHLVANIQLSTTLHCLTQKQSYVFNNSLYPIKEKLH